MKQERIIPVFIEEEMKTAYLDYSMSVIVSRALPDVYDGLKPVHRRILYAMQELHLYHDRPFLKSARIVGETMGKYHPHGDAAIYNTMVRMAQDFSMRYLLIDGQGNFGSIDGDPPAAMRYCVTGDTLVLTDKGIIPIEKISNKQESEINLRIINHQGKHVKASKFFDSGKHDIIKITTSRGYEIRGSYNHPILCWGLNDFGFPTLKWKVLQDITTNDYVVINRNFSLFSNTNPDLTCFYPSNSRYKDITLPKVMNKDLAFLLGALIAEGCFHQGQIVFNNKNLEFYNKIKDIIESQFPGVKLYEREIKGDCFELSIYHQQVVKFLENIGLNNVKSDQKKIPFTILSSKEEIIQQFLMALFEGDGSVTSHIDKRHGDKTIEIAYISKSYKLIHQLKVLLLNFGIITSFPFKDKRANCYKLLISGYENILRFKEKIGFFSERKQLVLSRIYEVNPERMSRTDMIPFLCDYLRTNYRNEFIQKNNMDRYNKLKENYPRLKKILNHQDNVLIEWLIKNMFFFDKVKIAEKLNEKEKVYSIKVEDSSHSFVANGFINHNTEARLTKIAEELLTDIDKDTVDFVPNYDDKLKEPSVLPSVFPNLLANGSSGIAVGMATNIPPHNLNEIIDGIIHLIDNPDAPVEKLMKYVQGPDFPTGAIIFGRKGIKDAYTTGRGSIILRAKANIETHPNGRESIIITEIPYQVNKSALMEKIAELVRDKKLEGVADMRDESDRDGMRIVIDLKKDVMARIIINTLYKHTQLQSSFGIIMLALVNNQPKLMNLKEMMQHFIDHRHNVVVRRTQFELKKAEARAHILEGLKIALDHIDEIIALIKKSRDPDTAKNNLMREFKLSEIQAKAILDMQLQKLTGLEKKKIEEEYLEIIKLIEKLKNILDNRQLRFNIIKDELKEIKKKYGDARRTEIVDQTTDLTIEDLIAEEDMVITISHAGYIKRMPIGAYRRQRRGGTGVTGMETKEEDFVQHMFIASTHSYIMFFTDKGKCYWLKVHEIPQAGRLSKGKAIINLIEIEKDEKISAFVPVKNFEEDKYLVMVTQSGLVKKTHLSEYGNPKRTGIIAINLKDNDQLVEAKLTDGNQDLILATRDGKAIRFSEKEVRVVGRNSQGVMGMRLNEGDVVIGMVPITREGSLLVVTENGYGKRTAISEFSPQGRGGKGVIYVKITEKIGKAISIMEVVDEDELMVITQSGMVIRLPIKDIRDMGRNTQGVKLIDLRDTDDKVIDVARLVTEKEEPTAETEETTETQNGETTDEDETEDESAEESTKSEIGEDDDN